ncbi:MAG: hypothetical protein Kow009_01490 [Spirochaetales bacterium]
MKRVLLVDDESHIVSGIRMLIKRYFNDRYTVVADASSGKEALEKTQAFNPEIILIDVQMPGISGLDVIRTLSQSEPTRAFILITAYERFEIAREALQLGVCDYLLKPISRDRLEIALNSASLYLERVKVLEEREMASIERERKYIPYLKYALFRILTGGSGSEQDLNFLLSALQVHRTRGCMAVAYFFPRQPDQMEALYHRFSRHLQYKTEALAGELVENRYCAVFLPLQNASGLQVFQETVEREFSSELAIGELVLSYGSVEPVNRMPDSWQEALRALFSLQRQEERGSTIQAWPWEWDLSLLKEVEAGRMGSAGRRLEEILSRIDRNTPISSPEGFRILTMMGFLVLHAAGMRTIPDETLLALLDFRDLLTAWEQGFTGLFMERVRERFDRILRLSKQHQSHSPLVGRTLHYIQNHFSEPITLESVAELMHVSPVTLSRQLTEETGMGFARTLINARLAKAKELLERGDFSIKKVGMACGYPDPNYFARLFKRETGVSPREYRAGNREVADEKRDLPESGPDSPDPSSHRLWKQDATEGRL